MCGVSACENRQNRVSHGESVRVGSSAILRIYPPPPNWALTRNFISHNFEKKKAELRDINS